MALVVNNLCNKPTQEMVNHNVAIASIKALMVTASCTRTNSFKSCSGSPRSLEGNLISHVTEVY